MPLYDNSENTIVESGRSHFFSFVAAAASRTEELLRRSTMASGYADSGGGIEEEEEDGDGEVGWTTFPRFPGHVDNHCRCDSSLFPLAELRDPKSRLRVSQEG